MKYKMKPIEIEAKQWEGNINSLREIQAFYPQIIDGGFVGATDNPNNRDSWPLFIMCRGYSIVAEIGDYIVKGSNGEFYACNPFVLELLYEPISIKPNTQVPVVKIYFHGGISTLILRPDEYKEIGGIEGALKEYGLNAEDFDREEITTMSAVDVANLPEWEA